MSQSVVMTPWVWGNEYGKKIVPTHLYTKSTKQFVGSNNWVLLKVVHLGVKIEVCPLLLGK